MCTVSMIGDHFRDKWTPPPIQPGIQPTFYPLQPSPIGARPVEFVPREEFDALKREVEEMKALLKRAKLYDEENGEPDCELDEEMDVLRKVARLVGIDLDDVIGRQEQV